MYKLYVDKYNICVELEILRVKFTKPSPLCNLQACGTLVYVMSTETHINLIAIAYFYLVICLPDRFCLRTLQHSGFFSCDSQCARLSILSKRPITWPLFNIKTSPMITMLKAMKSIQSSHSLNFWSRTILI